MVRVLLIDDDARLFELLSSYLRQNGVDLEHARDGVSGLRALSERSFDAVLLDGMMPGMDGLEVLRRIRERGAIPVLMLTARGDEADRVVGLELGADDYVAKPFSSRELLARLRAVLRRMAPAVGSERLSANGVEVEVGTREVRVDGQDVELVSVARAIGEGKLDRRMRLAPFGRRGREVAMIAEAINTMATRIERQLADQRELLAAVSHELRTPLGHLRVLIDTARERPGLDREQLSTLDELEREVVELDGLVDQLLVHSRLEFDRVEARALDPVGVAVRALERVGDDAGRLDIETEVESIVGDPTLLGRALANLLSNARTHGHGLERLRVYDEDGLLCFDVEDRGPGFADGEQERVFESFVQGRAREGGSLGLGLSLVLRIARAHGGRAWARNRAQGGACVGFGVALDGGPRRGDAVIASTHD